MNLLSKTLLFWTLVLSAYAQNISAPTIFPLPGSATPTPHQPPVIAPTTETPSDPPAPVLIFPKITVTVGTPHIDPGPNGEFPSTAVIKSEPTFPITDCGYQWAYEDLPKLTTPFDLAVKNVIPNSTSRVTASGENCVGSDGQVIRFLAMETDFHVTIPVESLSDYETFGNWIAQVMQIMNRLSPDLIAGPKPGFVEFGFEKNVTEVIIVRVPIQQYNETTNGKTGEELFWMFYTIP